MIADGRILVLGLGNSLLSDEGVGPHVIAQLSADGPSEGPVRYYDGGTLGLNLLPEIEDAAALIVVDASEFGAQPGTLKTFEGPDMDQQLGAKKHSVHEVALADLMGAAALNGKTPKQRALIAVQPGSTEWGLDPTSPVKAAIPEACAAVEKLIERWGA